MASFLGKLRFLKSPLTRRLATSVDASYKDSLPAKVSGHPEAGMEYQDLLKCYFFYFFQGHVNAFPHFILLNWRNKGFNLLFSLRVYCENLIDNIFFFYYLF